MMKLKSFNLILIFFVSFVCFLLGWLFAVFVLPGKKLQISAEKHTEQVLQAETPNSQIQEPALLEELKNNVLALFDPYKMDSLVKKNTNLEKKSSFIKKGKETISIKKTDEQPLAVSNLSKTNLDITEEIELSKRAVIPPPQILSPELQAIQESYDKKNKEQLLLIEKNQKFFKTTGKFSFMINVFSEQDKAFEFIKKMKKQYPMWSFLLKIHKDHIRVYLGPFSSKELAEEFKKSIPKPSPFSSLDFLKEVSL